METHQSLSDDIVSDILTYLLAKSFMRFKCISKAWNTITQHLNIIRSHYARSPVRPSAARLLFQLRTNPKNHWGRRDELIDLSLQLDYFFYDGEMRICSNHSNGLVCLYSFKVKQVYLFNVTTREIKALPPYVNQEIKIMPYHNCDNYFLLGFDQVTGNLKLLLLLPRDREEEAKILTLGVTNCSSWRKIDLLKYDSDSYGVNFHECIFLNGVVYLVGHHYVTYFDFGEEKFGYILSPPGTFFRDPSIMKTVIWGQLAIMSYTWRGFYQQYFGYIDTTNKVYIPTESRESLATPIDVVVALLGTEAMTDKTKEAHVLTTTSLMSALISMPCAIRFTEHSNKTKRPYIDITFVSRFVENIIPLKYLLV